MPAAVSATPDGVVLVELSGTLTQTEFDDVGEVLAGRLQPWSRLLIDAVSLGNPTEALTMVVRAGCRVVLLARVRQALVVGDNAAAAARTWTRLSAPGSAGVQVFTDRGAAIAWLMAEYQTTTGGS